MEKITEKLDNISRIIMDIRMASDFLEMVTQEKGVVNLVMFGTGEAIFTKITDAEKTQINTKITALIEELKTKVLDITK